MSGMLANIILIVLLVVIVGSAVWYIHKEKKRMLKEAKQDAIKGGLYEKTAEHAKVVITDYIHSLKGYENYNVVFNEEA